MHILTTLKMRVSTLQQITIILGVAFIMSMSIFNESLYPIEKIAWENAVPTFLTYINPIGWFSRAFSLTLFQGGQMRWLMEGFILIFFILISFYSFKRIRFKPVGKR